MTDHRKIELAASEWVARKARPDRVWSSDDEGLLEHWLGQDTAHRVAYIRLQVAWERSNKLKMLADPTHDHLVPSVGQWQESPFFAHRQAGVDAVARVAGRLDPVDVGSLRFERKPPARTLSVWTKALAAAVIVGLGIGAGVMGWYATGKQYQQFETAMGATGQESIADGSTATLSSNSEITASLSRSQRAISLNKGEAYFHVAKDPMRPFVVSTGETTVTAVGTRFSVRKDPGQIRLVVTEGTVRLERKTKGNPMPSAIFTAGAIVLVNEEGIQVQSRSAEQAEEAIGWIQGDVVFHGTTLEEAVGEFNRFNEKKLLIKDPQVSLLRVDGSFKVGNSEGFARLLGEAFPVRVVDAGNSTELYSR